MTSTDPIRTSPAARFLGITRRIAKILRAQDWTVRESARDADLVAMRAWQSPRLTADTRLLVMCHSGDEPALFSSTDSADEVLPSFGASTPFAPSPMRTKAGLFRADDLLTDTISDAFTSIPDVIDELQTYQHAIELDDAEDALEAGIELESPTPHTTFLHPIVITDAPLHLMTDARLTPVPSLRLIRTSAATANRAWIDIVHADEVESYVATLTKHYVSGMKKKKLG
ncbi:MAG TPA: hypothetical protein VF787_25620 [Thermoanaerobaculia bacterium]